MAHKKGQGTSRNGRDSNAQRLGFKAFGGQLVPGGTIIVRQRGTRVKPGLNVGRGKDDTLFAKITGRIKFLDKGSMGKFVMVEPEAMGGVGFGRHLTGAGDFARQRHREAMPWTTSGAGDSRACSLGFGSRLFHCLWIAARKAAEMRSGDPSARSGQAPNAPVPYVSILGAGFRGQECPRHTGMFATRLCLSMRRKFG